MEYLYLSILIFFLIVSVKIVGPSQAYVIERFGKFNRVAYTGFTIVIPFFEHVKSIVSLENQRVSTIPYKIITKDNICVTAKSVVYYEITDPQKAVYEIASLEKGIEYVVVTTLRDILKRMNFDSILNSKDAIQEELNAVLSRKIYNFGCKINETKTDYIIN